MSISILLAEKIAQLFLILLMGYLVVRVGLLKPEDSRVLSVIMVYLVMPCMILNAFQIDNTPEVRTGIAYSFVVAGIMHLLFLALTIPYVMHYYFLENSVQELYTLYYEVLKRLKK